LINGALTFVAGAGVSPNALNLSTSAPEQLRSFILRLFSHLAVSLVRQETGPFLACVFPRRHKKDAGSKQPIFDPAPNAEGTSMKIFCGLSGSNQRTLRRAISRLK